jgi:hypothetical protein
VVENFKTGKDLLKSAQEFRSWLYKYLVNEEGELRNIDNLRKYTGPIFAVVVFGLFLILVSGYALTYYSLQKAGIEVLPGLGEAPSLGLAWYNSLTVSTLALHQGVVPNSSIARVIQSLHLINAAMFLASALFLFSYAMGQRGKQEFNRLRDYPKQVITKLDKLITKLDSLESLPTGKGSAIDVKGDKATDDNFGDEP